MYWNKNQQCLHDVILSLTWEHINERTATNDIIRLRPETHLQTSYLSKMLSNSFTQTVFCKQNRSDSLQRSWAAMFVKIKFICL